jgi:flagellar L-ring protein precursor FlgH
MSGRGAWRSVAIWLALCALAGAEAQYNSLFRRGGAPRESPAPTTQPAAAARELLLPGPGAYLRPAGALPEEPPPNQGLLRRSLIAVEAPKQRRIAPHDLVTVIVREDKRSTTDAKLKSEKSWTLESELAKWFRIHDHKLVPQTFPEGAPGASFNFDNEYEGKGKVDRADTLTLRLTATVIDVKPNGTLTLEATKTIKVDEDTQTMTLTGVCRSDDVTADNTVLSTQLANVSIKTSHTGPARDAARRGWLMRLFDVARPL